MKKVLIACEESQAVCIEFRKLGIEAYSCDIQDCSGGYPEWHIKGDAIKEAYSGKYNLMIAHPPCTYMSKAGARWMYENNAINIERYYKSQEAKSFFIKLLNAPIDMICIENPTPLSIVKLPKPSQIIQPYEFGHEYSKKTLLWLKGLPNLKQTKIVYNHTPYLPSNTGGKKNGKKYSNGFSKNQKQHSKTFPGIAQAMAEQWSKITLPIQRTLF